MKTLQSKNDPFTPFTQGEQEGTIFNETTIPEYIRLKEAFAHWLRLLNFEPSTIKYAPAKLQEFLAWLESKGITQIEHITIETVTSYFDYLKTRPNKRKGGRLSKNSLRTHLTTLKRFARYLRESQQESFDITLTITGKLYHIKDIFTMAEIKALYEATGSDLIGLRDKAMLAVYYGCGLRRSEGVNLDVKDVLLDKNLLYVQKGKGHKERYIPLTEAVKETLSDYIKYARPVLLKTTAKALFLTQYGTRVKGNAMIGRLHQLKEKAGITKDTGLHSLRHSIATHLLQSGMSLEKIKQFLGHSSLESTQIYTHIIHENKSI
jgi:integrase/recombinase XerD